MTSHKNEYGIRPILILNRPNTRTDNHFYVEVFRIPEVLNRLRGYRDILRENDMHIPIWVYCLTQDIKSLMGSPQSFVLNFLISLGLFDRWIAKNGWPGYIVGSDPLISVIAGEISFEEQALLLSNGYCQESETFQLYKASSYYNNQTGSFCLTNLKKKQVSQYLKEILMSLKQKIKKNEEETDTFFQLLSPHEESLIEELSSFGIFPRDFLEGDQSLKWLWPIWKRAQIQSLKKRPSKICQ